MKNLLKNNKDTLKKAVLGIVLATLFVATSVYLANHKTALLFALTNEKEVLMVREARLTLDREIAQEREERIATFLAEKVVFASPLPDDVLIK
jgi:hypothetical protein